MSVSYVMIPRTWTQDEVNQWMVANSYSQASITGVTQNYTIYSQPQYPPDDSYPYTEQLENGVRLFIS